MEKDEIKHRIKAKYGTISRFAQMMGLNPNNVRTALSRDIPSARARREEIVELLKRAVPARFLAGVELNPKQAEAIRLAMATQYRFAVELHKRHPEFSQAFLSNVVNGKTVTQCKRVRRLAEVLDIKLEDYE
jgi:hypothetical protein